MFPFSLHSLPVVLLLFIVQARLTQSFVSPHVQTLSQLSPRRRLSNAAAAAAAAAPSPHMEGMTPSPTLKQDDLLTTTVTYPKWIVFVDHSKPSLEKGASATLDAFLSLAPDTVHVKTAFLPRQAKSGNQPWVRCVDMENSEALEVSRVDSVDKVYRVLTKHMGLAVSHNTSW